MDLRPRYLDGLAPALRRVQGVRVIVGDGHTRAEVYGMGHRHPVTLPISLGLAARLVQAGAPLELHDEESSRLIAGHRA